MKPFIALIGPPRIALGLVALAYGVLNIAFESILQGGFDLGRSGAEIFSMFVGVCNLLQEGIKAYLRPRFTIVEMDGEGIFDRRIMKSKLQWTDIEWIDPHPGGLPDRLRIMGRAKLTTFGEMRNFAIRTIRRLPKEEIIVTFGGLNKAGSQAATWIADHQKGLVPDVWKSKPLVTQAGRATQHSDLLISASVYWREWIGAYVSGIVLMALVAGLSPAFVASMSGVERATGLSALMIVLISLAVAFAVWTLCFSALFWFYDHLGDRLIRVSKAGFSDARVSSQFVPWSDVESVVFEYRDMGRLINELRPVYVQLREGLDLSMPSSNMFAVQELFRRATTKELIALKHRGTTTSVSEIIETLQRYEVPVAIREVARG